eukprot:4034870-Alexandrium_andersonii.AAC.1
MCIRDRYGHQQRERERERCPRVLHDYAACRGQRDGEHTEHGERIALGDGCLLYTSPSPRD